MTPMTAREANAAVHVEIEVKGDKASVELFHRMIFWCDPDWPWAEHAAGRSKSFWKRRICAKCGGRLYSQPRFMPVDIKAAARQANVKVKILRFAKCEKCYDNGSPSYIEPKDELPQTQGHKGDGRPF